MAINSAQTSVKIIYHICLYSTCMYTYNSCNDFKYTSGKLINDIKKTLMIILFEVKRLI